MIEQQQVVLYPSREIVTLEKRKDGGWNLHNESGLTTWNVPDDEVKRLIEYQKNREASEAQELRMEQMDAERRLAIEIDNAWDAATKYNNKLKKAAAREAHVPLLSSHRVGV